jgi:hypothetical protein
MERKRESLSLFFEKVLSILRKAGNAASTVLANTKHKSFSLDNTRHFSVRGLKTVAGSKYILPRPKYLAKAFVFFQQRHYLSTVQTNPSRTNRIHCY